METGESHGSHHTQCCSAIIYGDFAKFSNLGDEWSAQNEEWVDVFSPQTLLVMFMSECWALKSCIVHKLLFYPRVTAQNLKLWFRYSPLTVLLSDFFQRRDYSLMVLSLIIVLLWSKKNTSLSRFRKLIVDSFQTGSTSPDHHSRGRS
jgi:hypothetical protein